MKANSEVKQDMKTCAIVNQKGGVGKTSLASQLAYAANEAGLRVLLVDLDPQRSFSVSFPGTNAEGANVALDLFKPFEEGSKLKPEYLENGMAILRATTELRNLNGDNREGLKRPRLHLKALSEDFDVCIIDTPGALGFNPPMTMAALVAATGVVCPLSIGLFEGEAISDLWQYLQGVKRNGFNAGLKVIGLLPSKVNTRNKEEMAALAGLREKHGSMILPMTLSERTPVKRAINNRKCVWKGARGGSHQEGAREWKAATNHILTAMGAI